MQALISAHDQVANKEYPLQSVADNGDELIGEQALRIVYIEKKSDPLVSTSKNSIAKFSIVLHKLTNTYIFNCYPARMLKD